MSPRRVLMALAGTLTAIQWPPDAGAQSVLPRNGTVVSGQVGIGVPSANALTVTQSSSRAIVNWGSFSVGQPDSVVFVQPDASAAILNRVTGSAPSTIAGQITGNGQVFLVNPNGIAITPSGTVQVGGGFVASTLDIANADFNAGRLTCTGSGASAAVSNAGTISAARGGFVGLIGGTVANAGSISVPLGKVGLGSGEQATLDPTGDGFLQVALPTAATAANGGALVDVAGRVRAAGGRIEIKAATAQQAVRDAVNVSGSLSARSVSGRSGSIVLDGGAGGDVTISGKLSVSGAKRAPGGTIIATGRNLTLTPGARLDASGTKGGTILIGGDLRGGLDPAMKLVPAPVQTAQTTTIAQGAEINASGTTGAGGNVVVWSDAFTSFHGTINANGSGSGAGGAVEVSSHGVLDYAGMVDVRAVSGRTGTLMLDPFDVTISNGADTNISNSGNTFSPTGNSSILSVTSLQNALATANVTVNTGSGGAQNGDITVANAVTWASGNTLTLSAARDIVINAGISTTGGGTLTLTAGRNVDVNSNITASSGTLNVNLTASASAGSINVTGATINTNGGNLIASATQNGSTDAITLSNATLSVGGGTGTLTGTASSGNGVTFSGASMATAGIGGSLSINGSSSSGYGVNFSSSASLTTSGNISVSGVTSSAGMNFAGGDVLTVSSGSLSANGTATSGAAVGVQFNGATALTNSGGALAITGTGTSNGVFSSTRARA